VSDKVIPKVLEQIAMLLEIKGENPFKSRAYYNAARTLENVDDLERLAREKRLRDIKGIGAGLSKNIEELVETGRMTYFEDLKEEVPESLLGLLQIPNLGPKKIKVLHEKLGITSIGELEYACSENRLVSLYGFGLATQQKILKGIDFIKKHKGEFLFGDVCGEAESIKGRFEAMPLPPMAEVCGSIRRKKEVVRDIDVLVGNGDHKGLSDYFISLPEVDEVLLQGETKTSCRLRSGIEADLRVVSRDEFPYALMYFTGSKEHNVRLRALARKRSWKLNEYGLFDENRLVSLASEEEIYRALGLSFIPAELREDMGEIEAALAGTLPTLLTDKDIQGVFHVHTDFSDGSDTLEAMVAAAKKLGFSFLGVTDHSKSAYYAGGLNRDDILRQREMIDRLNSRDGSFHVFKGIESDILADGRLDYDDEILEGFDFVIASVHSGFTMKRGEMQARIMRALENPYTTMIGHPTGRLLLSRDGYDVDMHAVIDAAAENHTIIELNASPYRFDIDWRLLKYSKEKHVMISINPDAHAASGLSDVFLGVGIARKGWQEGKDVLNTRNVNDIKDIFDGIRDEKER
jgi:DNA polymerase (family 10)